MLPIKLVPFARLVLISKAHYHLCEAGDQVDAFLGTLEVLPALWVTHDLAEVAHLICFVEAACVVKLLEFIRSHLDGSSLST